MLTNWSTLLYARQAERSKLKKTQKQTKKQVNQPCGRANNKVFGTLIDSLSICFLCAYQITANICHLVTDKQQVNAEKQIMLVLKSKLNIPYFLAAKINKRVMVLSNINYHSNFGNWDWRKGMREVVHTDSKQGWFWMLTPELSTPWFWRNSVCARQTVSASRAAQQSIQLAGLWSTYSASCLDRHPVFPCCCPLPCAEMSIASTRVHMELVRGWEGSHL